MTHTFKLARRMARFRVIAAVTALLVACSCGGEDLATTAPSAPDTAPNDTLAPADQAPNPEPVPNPAPSLVGIPFGPSDAWNDVVLKADTDVFSASVGASEASSIVQQLQLARSQGVKLILAMTGGSHNKYLTNGVFDQAKWHAKMNSYDTPEIKAAVAAAVVDGTLIGTSVMDEPNVYGAGDGNTWGPPGTMTKKRVDALCAHVKSMFPTLPVGVAQGHNAFEPEKSYAVCEFIIDQYSSHKGDVTQYREEGVALARRDGHAVMFAMNILNGGMQDRDGRWDCRGNGQAGRGTHAGHCRMTAQQVRDYGLVLGPAGCALVMWRYDSAFMAKAENQQSFRDVAGALASAPARSCGQPA
jgi:hypothetical protein